MIRSPFAAIALAASLLLGLASGSAIAAPAAGTIIGNQATATYNDAGGTPRTATSNLVTTVVQQVKSFTLTANGNRTAAAGQAVYYPHTLTNTGNGTDTYSLNPLTTGGTFAHTGLAYFSDADGNGVPDNFTPITSSGAVAMGGIFRFVAAGTVPGTATNGSSGTITVSVTDTATPTANTLTNLDTTTVANAAILVSKSLSVTAGASPNAGPITVTLSYSNTGSAAGSNLQVTDTLPAGMTYIPGSAMWSVSGALSDAAGGDPAGITYQSTGGVITFTVATVAAGFAGNGTVTFGVQIAAGLPPGPVTNVALYQTATQPSTSSNPATYQVARSANVIANGSITSSVNGTGEPVTIASAAAGSPITFQNIVWNLGNAPDSFDMTMSFPSGAWPAGTTFTFLRQDNATNLIDTNGNGTPDTGDIPVYAAGCPATFVADVANQRCGYRVMLRVQLPAAAGTGPYTVRKTATSRFDNTRTDTVDDVLTAVVANSVDLTNNAALPGGAGAGATGTTVITTNTVTPSATLPTVTRFRLYVNNTSSAADSFDLGVTGTPAGWTVSFRADGGAGDCSTVGAPLTNTGLVAAAASFQACAEVTLPVSTSGQAAPGTYNLDFRVASAVNAAVNDVKRDAVTVNALHLVTLVANGAQQTFPGGTATYTHTIANLGNVPETITFPAGFLTNSRPGWTAVAYVDGNNNGVFEAGIDDVPANQLPAGGAVSATLQPLAVNASRALFVRVTAPAGALAADPANLTTLTATYNAGTQTVAVVDSTTVSDGLILVKRQRMVNCDGTAPGTFSTAAIPAGPGTAAGACLQYTIRATNTTAIALTAVVVTDAIPAFMRQRDSCGAPATTLGTITAPGDGNTGTLTVNLATLNAGQFLDVSFCARINP